MNLQTTFDNLSDELVIDNTLDPETAVNITSGGLWPDEKQPVPALYAQPELAIKAWLRTLHDHIGPKGKNEDICVRWMEKPIMDRYQITVMDTKELHRLVNDRFSVFSRVVIRRRRKDHSK